MAAGDRRVKITRLVLQPDDVAILEYEHRVESKASRIQQDSRGGTVVVKWADFTALFNPQERNVINNLLSTSLSHVKGNAKDSVGNVFLSSALDD